MKIAAAFVVLRWLYLLFWIWTTMALWCFFCLHLVNCLLVNLIWTPLYLSLSGDGQTKKSIQTGIQLITISVSGSSWSEEEWPDFFSSCFDHEEQSRQRRRWSDEMTDREFVLSELEAFIKLGREAIIIIMFREEESKRMNTRLSHKCGVWRRCRLLFAK